MTRPAIYPQIGRRSPLAEASPGVYANLDELIRLQFRSQGFSLLPRQPIHSLLAGRHASRLRGRGLNFEEMRRYLPGDDVRHIDWRVTARTRKPFVRVYAEERDRPLLLIVDQRSSMFFGSVRAMKSVVAAEVAALAAWRVLNAGDRVGAIVFDDRDIDEIPPRRSREQVMRVLQSIVTKNHALRADAGVRPNPGALNEVLQRAVRIAKHDFLVCLVSDTAGADAASIGHVTTLAAHNDVLSIFVYDPLEVQLPDAGRLIAVQGELQLEVDSSDATLRSSFRTDFEQRLSRIRESSREREIPVLPISAAEDVPTQLKTLLGRQAAVRRK